MESCNLINNANVDNPDMSLSSSNFGKSYDIYPQADGRRLRLGLRLRHQRSNFVPKRFKQNGHQP